MLDHLMGFLILQEFSRLMANVQITMSGSGCHHFAVQEGNIEEGPRNHSM